MNNQASLTEGPHGRDRFRRISIRRRTLLVLAAPALLMGAGCENPEYKYRYRFTLEVEYDGKTYRDAVVREDKVQYVNQFPPQASYPSVHQTGEAAMVVLPDGRAVAALLTNSPASRVDEWVVGRTPWSPIGMLPKALGVYSGFQNGANPGLRYLEQVETSPDFAVPRSAPAAIVVITDIDSAQSIEPVNLRQPARTLGDSAQVRAYVAVTTDPITKTLRGRLPMVAQLEGNKPGPSRHSPAGGAYKAARLDTAYIRGE